MPVELDAVHLTYDRPVLKDVALTLAPGDFRVLMGPSGSGKTSLLKLIHGLERPTAGRVLLFGKDTTGLDQDSFAALRRRIGFVFQDFRLIPHLTALENAALPLRLTGASPAMIRDHVAELLAWTGLKDRMHALPHEMSGGEQQRVALARAIVHKPALVLADEPTGHVDAVAAERLLHLFSELNAMGIAVLLATHQKDVAAGLDQPILRLDNGTLILPADESRQEEAA